MDVGTSGGVFGLERGFCLMIGGEDGPVEQLDPIFKWIAPGAGTAEPTPGRTRSDTGTAQDGYLHCGPSGSGHFVKMVHNGIEYGMMAAIAEGLSIIKHANVGKAEVQADDAETTPLRDPQYYQYDIDVAEVAEVWRRGSVVSSWLMDLTADALARSPAAGRLRRARLGLRRGPVDGDRRRSTRACLRRSSPPRCSSGSSRAASASSATSCCPRCAASSAGTRKSRPATPGGAWPLTPLVPDYGSGARDGTGTRARSRARTTSPPKALAASPASRCPSAGS